MTDQDRDFGAGVPGMIAQACYELRDFLHEKNRKYGNSALDPVRILSKASPVEQILVRIDDKLSRLRSGQTDDTEDVEWDLLGYLLLLRVARKHETASKTWAGLEIALRKDAPAASSDQPYALKDNEALSQQGSLTRK